MTVVSYDNLTGTFNLTNDKRDPSYFTKVVQAVCFDTMLANSCVVFASQNAIKINSRYHYNITGLDYPQVEGILLQSSLRGSTGIFANTPNCLYTTELELPGNYNDTLYVGKDGMLTNIVPSSANGDFWHIEVGLKVDRNKLIYAPKVPIDITENPAPTPVPLVIGNDETIVLSQYMEKFTCFRINKDGKAYIVTASDPTTPYIDGMTLEAGSVDQVVHVARLKNYYYETGHNFLTGGAYWLSNSGVITQTQPTGVLYVTLVGRSIPNSTKFIFDPHPPIDNTGGGGGSGLPELAPHPDTFLFNDGSAVAWRKVKQSDIVLNPDLYTPYRTFEVGQQINPPEFTFVFNEIVQASRLIDSVNNVWTEVDSTIPFSSPYNFTSTDVATVTFTLESLSIEHLICSVDINWYHRIYHGTAQVLTDITELDYTELQATRACNLVAESLPNCYYYFVFPVTFGTPVFNVGGLEGGFEFFDTTTHTNFYGIDVPYNIYRSENLSLGSMNIVVS